MTERDELLIKVAKTLKTDEWDLAYNLADMAQSDEGKEDLQKKAKLLYLKHEGSDI